MNGQQLPCRKPKRGDILDGFSGVSGGYEYDPKSKKFKGSGGELDIALASYGDRAWASFGFTDPQTW